jgi:ComF family protein
LHPKVAKAMSAWPYVGWVSRSVIDVKYNGEKDRARFLGAVLAMSEAATLLGCADYIVPVPMHEKKRLERGYNQVELMTDVACRQIGCRAPEPIIVQHEARPSQVRLSARERRVNVRGTFSLNPAFSVPAGARLVIVDDVRTTGATIAACVDVVRTLRPRRIDVVTLAAELSRDVMDDLGLAW